MWQENIKWQYHVTLRILIEIRSFYLKAFISKNEQISCSQIL